MSPTPASTRSARRRSGRLLVLAAALSAAACVDNAVPHPPLPPPLSATLFEEVTEAAGIDHAGPSYGVAVGDFDGDQWPDIWVSNHWHEPTLYRNSADGTFDVATQRHLGTIPKGDMHGAAWADFDRDGDQDLVELAGANRGRGRGPNKLFVHGGEGLRDRALSLGVDAPLGRARSPLWLDWEADGDLDLVMTGMLRPDKEDWSGLFLQQNGRFERAPMSVLGRPQGFLFAQLADVTGDPRPELVLAERTYPRRILSPGAAQAVELTGSVGLPPTGQVSDAVWADFDGDLRRDLFLVTHRGTPTLATPAPNRLVVNLHGTNLGIRFRTPGRVLLKIYPQSSIRPENVRLGASGSSPTRPTFRLDPENTDHHGLMDYAAGSDSGLYAGFDPTQGTWTVMHSHPDWRKVNVVVRGQTDITDIEPIRFNPDAPQPENRLFLRQESGFGDRTREALLYGALGSVAVVAADFDHDMDQDLYLLQTGSIENLPNLLYLNRGDGTFQQVAHGGGAAGSDRGRADAVATLDYDRDGDLDIFVVNGLETEPFSTDGPHQIFANLVDSAAGLHHWLQVDLVGTESNVEAIGARVMVTAGGVTQLRVQDHGMHRSTQDEAVLHFGLGPHRRAEQVVIHWPSGRVQMLRDIDSDRMLRVVEPVRADS